jgi:threonyl-tRNA synthetase
MVSSLIQSNQSSSQQDSEKLALIHHACAHIMAMGVQKLHPGTKVAMFL